MGGRSRGDSQNPEKKAQHRAKVLQVANSERVWDNTVISNLWTAKICLPVTQTTLFSDGGGCLLSLCLGHCLIQSSPLPQLHVHLVHLDHLVSSKYARGDHAFWVQKGVLIVVFELEHTVLHPDDSL